MTCPACGGRGLRLIFGRPGPELIEQADRGEVVLGGCAMSDETHQCKECNLRFQQGSKESDLVHEGVACDVCNTSPLVGQRFKCDVCPDFDVCGGCLAREPRRHDAHTYSELLPGGKAAPPSTELVEYLKRAVNTRGARGQQPSSGTRGDGGYAGSSGASGLGAVGSGPNWPELVGTDGSAAVAAIKAARPDLNVQKIPRVSMVTMDVRSDRVRVFVDTADKVVKAPKIH